MTDADKKDKLNYILQKYDLDEDLVFVDEILDLIEECEDDSYEAGKWDAGWSLMIGS